MPFFCRCEGLFDTGAMVLVSLDLKVVCPSKLGETSSSFAEWGELGTLQGVPCPDGSASRPPWHFASGGRSMTDLPWLSPWVRGSRGVILLRRFAVSPRFLCFGAFLEVPTLYRGDCFG